MLRTARRGAEVATGVGFVVVAKDVCTDRTSLDDAPPPARGSSASPKRARREGVPSFEVDDPTPTLPLSGGRGRGTHQPNHSALRGSSTVLTFSSLIAPLAIRSLMSPSVAPATF